MLSVKVKIITMRNKKHIHINVLCIRAIILHSSIPIVLKVVVVYTDVALAWRRLCLLNGNAHTTNVGHLAHRFWS